MLDKMMEKLMTTAATAYVAKLGTLAMDRKAELEGMRSRVFTHPEEVQAWFEKEIKKLETMDVADMLTVLKDENK
jgi:hypothetical protein